MATPNWKDDVFFHHQVTVAWKCPRHWITLRRRSPLIRWFSWVTNVTMEDSIDFLHELAWISTLLLWIDVCVQNCRTNNVPWTLAQSRKASGFQLFVFSHLWCLGLSRKLAHPNPIIQHNICIYIIFYSHASWTSQFWAQQFLGKSIDFRGSPWIRASREFC